jgi:pimeloyl-ACP methyl ester carboxylesterase
MTALAEPTALRLRLLGCIRRRLAEPLVAVGASMRNRAHSGPERCRAVRVRLVDRPRLLLIPWITQLEWRITPLLEDWADVAAYDCPGVGDEPGDPSDAGAIIARGVAELDRRGGDRWVIVSDEFANAIAVHIARERPDAVAAMALGHACLSYERGGDDAPVRAELMAGFDKLLDTDYRSWVRAYTQITQGAYDDTTMQGFLERVPPGVCQRHSGVVDALNEDIDIGAELRRLDVPLLFAQHRECLVFTPAGYDEARAAFPGAETVTTEEKPNCSPAFAHALRSFVEQRVSAHA